MQKQKKQKPLIQQTSKLFYSKWLYKIGLTGIPAAVYRKPNAIQLILTDAKFANTTSVNNLKIANILSLLAPDEYYYRVYAGKVLLFLNCGVSFEKILDDLKYSIVEAYSPKDNAEILQTDKHVLLVESLPYKTYTYNVQLKFSGVPKDTKINFINWLNTQGTTVKIANSARRSILHKTYHANTYTLYTSSEPLITLMQIKYGNIISSVQSYKLVDK